MSLKVNENTLLRNCNVIQTEAKMVNMRKQCFGCDVLT